jgi:hypothetical protein
MYARVPTFIQTGRDLSEAATKCRALARTWAYCSMRFLAGTVPVCEYGKVRRI